MVNCEPCVVCFRVWLTWFWCWLSLIVCFFFFVCLCRLFLDLYWFFSLWFHYVSSLSWVFIFQFCPTFTFTFLRSFCHCTKVVSWDKIVNKARYVCVRWWLFLVSFDREICMEWWAKQQTLGYHITDWMTDDWLWVARFCRDETVASCVVLNVLYFWFDSRHFNRRND